MSTISHLRNKLPDLPLPARQPFNANSIVNFHRDLERLDPNAYQQILSCHPILQMEYNILCHQLHELLENLPPNVPPSAQALNLISKQIHEALLFAKLLEYLSLHCLNVPREVARLRKHQDTYRTIWERIHGPLPMNHEDINLHEGLNLSQLIREYTGRSNLFRLLTGRIRRFLTALDVFGTKSPTYHHFVTLMDVTTNRFFAYLAWCFFIPRLSTNLFLLAKHTIPWPWMDDKERALGWWVRLSSQMKRRWFELANDSVWLIVGLLQCFLLTGPVSVYLSLAAFAFDVAIAGLRAYIELRRLSQLQTEYRALISDLGDNQEELIQFQNHINCRIKFEEKRLLIPVANTSAVLIAMCCTIPTIASNPVIPLIGAVLLLTVWFINYFVVNQLQAPADNIKIPRNLGFFPHAVANELELRASIPQTFSAI